jgi:hypothetical protein
VWYRVFKRFIVMRNSILLFMNGKNTRMSKYPLKCLNLPNLYIISSSSIRTICTCYC